MKGKTFTPNFSISSRTFALICFTANNEETSIQSLYSIEDLFYNDCTVGNDSEELYALQDQVDTILDLAPGEQVPVYLNRDNKKQIGIIKRFK